MKNHTVISNKIKAARVAKPGLFTEENLASCCVKDVRELKTLFYIGYI